MEYFSLAAAVISVVTLIAVIVLSKKMPDDTATEIKQQLSKLEKSTADEFMRSRMENAQFQTNMTGSVSESIAKVTDRLSSQSKEYSEHQLRLNRILTESLENIREKNEQQNDRQTKLVEAAIGKMLESNEKKLDEMRTTVDEKLTSTLTQRLDSSFKTVSEQLEKLYKSLGEMKELSTGVTDNVTALNRVLTNVKARGTWAEVQLENILDQTIPNMYIKNFAPGSGLERVEFAVKIPSGDDTSKLTYLPIDSKFPMEDYVRLCNAADSADAAALTTARKALEDRVYGEAKTVAKYINVPLTTPFAIMYLATEGLYAEIVSSKNGLAEKIQNDFNVMLAGPTTVTALLNSLAMGFRTVAINEKANEIRAILGAVKSQYSMFDTALAKAKKKIDDAGKSLDDAQHRNDIIQKKLRSVEALDTGDASALLGTAGHSEVEDTDE